MERRTEKMGRRGGELGAEKVWNRSAIAICAMWLLMVVAPAAAQVEYKGASMRMSGFLNFGYAGDLPGNGEGAGTDHGMQFGGQGDLEGYYYNPNFISFSAQPYYNRSQANSDSGSLFDSSGYNANINIFSGSHFPGSISFSQSHDSSGVFGIPQTTGLTTNGNSRSASIGWAALIPDWPSLSVGYSRGSGSSSVLGSSEEGDSNTQTFTAHSGYRLWGTSLGAGFIHTNLNSSSTGFEAGQGFSSDTSTNTYTFSASRGFPTGGFGFGFSRSSYSDNYSGDGSGGSQGTTDSVFGTVGTKLWRIPLTGTLNYTDNVAGSFVVQQIGAGSPVTESSLSPESRSLTMSLSSSQQILPHVFVTAFVSRQNLYLAGSSYGLTQYGANVTGNFGERFKGLTMTVGVVDSANQVGNEGGQGWGTANYRRNIRGWELEGNFVYSESAQTLVAIYQTSSLSYGGSLRHTFAHRVHWTLGGGAGRSGFVQEAGDKTRSESVTTSLAAYRCNLSGSYSKSSGAAVVTPTGLVPVPLPIVTNNVIQFEGQSKGVSASLPVVRGMSLWGSYSHSNNSTNGLTGLNALGDGKTSTLTGNLTYQFRKVYFNAGVLQFRQGLAGSATAPSVVTSYYFGISRWFKAF